MATRSCQLEGQLGPSAAAIATVCLRSRVVGPSSFRPWPLPSPLSIRYTVVILSSSVHTLKPLTSSSVAPTSSSKTAAKSTARPRMPHQGPKGGWDDALYSQPVNKGVCPYLLSHCEPKKAFDGWGFPISGLNSKDLIFRLSSI